MQIRKVSAQGQRSRSALKVTAQGQSSKFDLELGTVCPPSDTYYRRIR